MPTSTNTIPKVPPARPVSLDTKKVGTHSALQCRDELSDSAIDDYVGVLERGDHLDPITVCKVDDDYYITDGHHRLAAHERFGTEKLDVRCVEGDMDTARLMMAEANTRHGVRRSNAYKRKQVEAVLGHPESDEWSSNSIAKRCNVSDFLVNTVRSHLLVQEDSPPQNHTHEPQKRLAQRNGTTYEVDTSRIGKSKGPPKIKKRVVPKDAKGNELPDDSDIRGAFAEAYRFDEVVSEINDIVRRVGELRESLAGREMGGLSIVSSLKSAKGSLLTYARPHAVCPAYPQCSSGSCTTCGGQGWVTKQRLIELCTHLAVGS